MSRAAIVLCGLLLGFGPATPAATNLSLRLFPIAPYFLDVVVEGGKPAGETRGGEFIEMSSGATRVKPRNNLDLRKYFSELGVGFPEGSYIHHRSDLNGLLMYNTEANHRRLGRLLFLRGSMPQQLEIDFAFVAFPREDIAQAARSNAAAAPTRDQLRAMWKAGRGRLAACAKVVTRSGVNAQVTAAQEVIYPTEFEATSFQGTLSAKEPKDLGALTLPGSFETRQAGLIVNVTPTLGPDNRTIDLTMVPEQCTLEGWDTIETPLLAPGQAPGTARILQPSFHEQLATTCVMAEDGYTVLLGGLPNRAGTEWLYFFVTPRVMDARGSTAGAFAGYPLDDDPAGGPAP